MAYGRMELQEVVELSGNVLQTPIVHAAGSLENSSPVMLKMARLRGSLQGVSCFKLWKGELVASSSQLSSLLAVTKVS